MVLLTAPGELRRVRNFRSGRTRYNTPAAPSMTRQRCSGTSCGREVVHWTTKMCQRFFDNSIVTCNCKRGIEETKVGDWLWECSQYLYVDTAAA
jgi:hypothetical protein